MRSHLRVGDPLTALPSTNIAALLIRRKHVIPRPDMFPGVRFSFHSPLLQYQLLIARTTLCTLVGGMEN